MREKVKNTDKVIDAIKTLQRADMTNPLEKHDFDSFIIESLQRQRKLITDKKEKLIQRVSMNDSSQVLDM